MFLCLALSSDTLQTLSSSSFSPILPMCSHKGWYHISKDGSFVTGDPLSSSKAYYELTVQRNTWAFISTVQPKKRANTQTTYWYADPSFVILKRKKRTGISAPLSLSSAWECEQVKLVGFLRTSSVEIFLDAAFQYICVPLSCKHHQKEAPFRVCAYSAHPVQIQRIDKDKHAQMVPVTLESIHRHLLKDERKLHYAVSTQASLVCVHGQRCLYFLVVNGSRDTFLSLHLSIQVPKGVIVAYGPEKDTHDVRPLSQRILVVVASDGTLSNAVSIRFSYGSDTTKAKSNTCSQTTNQARPMRLDGTVDISMVGELLTGAGQAIRTTDQSQRRGGDTIETFQWLNQIGSTR